MSVVFGIELVKTVRQKQEPTSNLNDLSKDWSFQSLSLYYVQYYLLCSQIQYCFMSHVVVMSHSFVYPDLLPPQTLFVYSQPPGHLPQ
jgi:hypothetical protein